MLSGVALMVAYNNGMITPYHHPSSIDGIFFIHIYSGESIMLYDLSIR